MAFLFLLFLSTLYNEISPEEFKYIFRDSALLKEVQLRQVFDNPEDFLHLKLLKPQREILYDFKELKLFHVPIQERKSILKQFVERNFENVTGLEHSIPTDFKKSPKFLQNVQDKKLRQTLERFNLAWLQHGRKLAKDVVTNPQLYSFIPVPRPFFVSTDKDQEMGYWESFWIFQGLMACDMLDSARNLLENLFSMVEKLGHCPPYNRVYYMDRTSPPMLPFMMTTYLERTKDTNFLSRHIANMASDLTAWVRQRLTLLKSPFHAFFIVVDDWWPQIRQECYREDIMALLGHKPSIHGPRQMFWEADESVLKTSVLLTTITEASARTLAPWLREYGHKATARFLENISSEMNYTLQNLLRIGDCWQDLHLDKGYKEETMSSLSPMWLGTAKLPCESARKAPISTGPEAVVALGDQTQSWMSDICRVRADNLVDISAAFHICRTTMSVLDHPPKADSRIKPLPFVLLVVSFVLFGYWMSLGYKLYFC